MAYGSYFGNGGYGYSMYTPPSYNNSFNSFQQSPFGNRQQVAMNAQPQNQAPINDIRFVNSDEAKAYIVGPNQNALLLDTQGKVAYIKSADGMGQSTCKVYRYEEINDKKSDAPKVDLESYVKKTELGDFVKKEDISALVQEVQRLQKLVGNFGGQPDGIHGS